MDFFSSIKRSFRDDVVVGPAYGCGGNPIRRVTIVPPVQAPVTPTPPYSSCEQDPFISQLLGTRSSTGRSSLLTRHIESESCKILIASGSVTTYPPSSYGLDTTCYNHVATKDWIYRRLEGFLSSGDAPPPEHQQILIFYSPNKSWLVASDRNSSSSQFNEMLLLLSHNPNEKTVTVRFYKAGKDISDKGLFYLRFEAVGSYSDSTLKPVSIRYDEGSKKLYLVFQTVVEVDGKQQVVTRVAAYPFEFDASTSYSLEKPDSLGTAVSDACILPNDAVVFTTNRNF